MKTLPGGQETIVAISRKSSVGRHSVTPVVKWERTGGRKVPTKTRMSYCEIESA